MFFMINFPRLIIPGVLFLIGSVPLALYPTRKKRALDQFSMDYDISVGKLPPDLDILLNGDTLTNEEIKALEAGQRDRQAAGAKAEEERRRGEQQGGARFKLQEQARAEEEADALAAIAALAAAESEDDASDEEMAEARRCRFNL